MSDIDASSAISRASPVIEQAVESLHADIGERRSVRESAPSRRTGDKADQTSTADINQVVATMNDKIHSVSTKLSFRIDERTSRPVILVYAEETGQVIRQIPLKETLEIMEKLNDVTGLIYHHEA